MKTKIWISIIRLKGKTFHREQYQTPIYRLGLIINSNHDDDYNNNNNNDDNDNINNNNINCKKAFLKRNLLIRFHS